MKLYLAAPYYARDWLRRVSDNLAYLGHESTSSWLLDTHTVHPGTEGTAPDMSDGYAQQHVFTDFDDIEKADALVMFTPQACWGEGSAHSGGRHVEVGYALARRKLVFVVGEAENIFHRGACVVVANLAELLVQLDRLPRSSAACEECGNDDPAEGYTLCTDCLERG